jgi:uncharacterized protein (TIGR02453 family)
MSFDSDFLQFFIELAPNNNKSWFDLNRKRYIHSVKIPFQTFIGEIIDRLSLIDPEFKLIEPKDCIFRINRDIRFSKDKSPYKLMTSALIRKGGKKSENINGIYLELGPEHIRIYAGVYEINPENLLRIRMHISNNLSEFKKLYTSDEFVNCFGTILGEKNKVLPPSLKTFASKETLLYNKQWYFYRQLEPGACLSKDFIEIIMETYKIAAPIQAFFQNGINSEID